MELSGRRIMITGAATGIGAAAVAVLADAGAHIVATHHKTTPPDGLAATWLQCDVRDTSSVQAAVAEAVKTLGGLDVLVHAAGLWQSGIPGSIDVDDLDHVMATNFTSTVLTNQSAFHTMKNTGGQILNFASSEGVMGSPISAGYAASKAAVAAWTRSAAKAWASHGVTVNALAPAVNTPGADRVREFLGPDAEAFLDKQLQMSIPLGGKLGDPDRDLGPVLKFLCGDGAGFITGQLLAVDGGLVMLSA